MKIQPVLSVCCITYNHVAFIGKCIEGFLEQITDFPIEILIFDDASTDGTAKIIEEYAGKDKRILTFLQNENQWIKGKYGLLDWLFPAAKGKYITICEGDDYWTDPLKLQKQVDFLEQHSTYAGCCHNVQLLHNDIEFSNHDTVHANHKLYLQHLIQHMPGGMIATCSLIFKRMALGNTNWIKEMHFGDFPLWINIYQSGPIYGMADYMGVYRKHSGGFSYGFNWDGYQVAYPKFYQAAREHVPAELIPLLNYKTFEVYYHAGSQFVARGEWKKASISFRNMLPFTVITGRHIKSLVMLGSKLFFYPVYRTLKFFKQRG